MRIIALLLLIFCSSHSQAQSAYEWFQKGSAEKDNQKKIEYFNESIRLDPVYKYSYLSRGIAKFVLKKYDEALRDYDEAIRLDPDYTLAHYSRGNLNRTLEKYEDALRDYDEVIRLDPKDTRVYTNRGIVKSCLGQFEECIHDYTKAIELSPGNANAFNNRAWDKIPLGKYEEALLDADEAIRLLPRSMCYTSRAWVKYYFNEYAGALNDFNEAIRLDPKNSLAFLGRSFCNLKINKYYNALNDVNESIVASPNEALAFACRGIVNMKLGNVQDAKNDLAKSKELIRDKRSARLRWDYDKASDELTQLLNSSVSQTAVVTPSGKTIALKKVALVIGVKSYIAVPPLTNTLNDARDVATSLRTKGFEVIELLDPKTKTEMRTAAIKFSKALEGFPDGVGLLYYSGHGMQIDGANYLIPATATLDVKADVQEQCMDMDYFLRIMEANGNQLNIVVLDACRNNPFRSFTRAADKGLSMVSAPKGSYIVYSTKPGSVASDGVGRNGLFTSKFLKYLNEPDLSIEQVFKRVAADVATASNDSQRPWIASDYTGEFFFSRKSGQ